MIKYLERLSDVSRKDLFFENPLNNEPLLWFDVMYIIRQRHHHRESCAENVKRQLCGDNMMESISCYIYSLLKMGNVSARVKMFSKILSTQKSQTTTTQADLDPGQSQKTG